MEKLLFGEVSCLRSRSKKKKIGSHAIIIIVVVVASFFSLVAFDCFPLALSPIRSVRRRLRLECACRGQRERNKKPRRARSLAREKLAASSSSGRRNKEQAPRSPSPQFHLSRSLFQAPNKGVPFLIRLASTRYLHSRPVVADHAQLAQPARARVAFLVMKMRRRRLAVRLGDRGHRRRAPADGGGRRRGAGGLGDGGRRRGHRAVRSAGEGREEPPGEEGGGGRGHGCKKKKKRVERRQSGVNVLMNHTLALCLAFAKPSLHSLFLFTAGLPRKRRISLFFSTQGSLLHGSYRSPSEFDRALSGRAVKRARRKRARELSFD